MLRATVKRHHFTSDEACAGALADRIAADLRQGLSTRGNAALAVSGGQTPKRLFEVLSTISLDWKQVMVTLVDERWVPETSSRSNARLVRETLLQNRAAAANFLPLYRNDCSIEDVSSRGTKTLKVLLKRGFDAVVLGLGLDGHTASFFPGGDTLNQAIDFRAAPGIVVLKAAGAGEPRVTFSASALVRTSGLYIQVVGADKATVLECALQDGPITELPIRAILNQDSRPVDIYQC